MATCVNMVISLLPELNPQAPFCGDSTEGGTAETRKASTRIIDKT